MVIDQTMGLDSAIAAFEEGWLSGSLQQGDRRPAYSEPSLCQYWHDGYDAGLAERRGSEKRITTVH